MTKKVKELKEKTKLTVIQDGKEQVREITKPTLEEVAQYKVDFETAIENFKDKNFEDPIPKTLKPLAAPYTPSKDEIALNWKNIGSTGSEFDVANIAYGGKILKASNEHYGPAIQIISPFGPMNMFDGFESARSRQKNHFEEAIIELGRPSVIHRIVVDFCYFVNNNPYALSFQGLPKGEWITIVDQKAVKAYAANECEFKIDSKLVFDQIRVIVHPDGGINRVRVYSKL